MNVRRRRCGPLLLGAGAALCAAGFIDGPCPRSHAATRYIGIGNGSLLLINSGRPINLHWWSTESLPGYFQLFETIDTGAGWCAALPLCVPGAVLVGAGAGFTLAARRARKTAAN